MAHCARALPWQFAAPGTRRVEQAILEAAGSIFRLPAVAGPAGARVAAGREAQQLLLPLRHGGFGLRAMSALEADAAHVASAALAQATLADGLACSLPFTAPTRAALLVVWRRVFDAMAADLEWAPPLRDLPEDTLRELLPGVQSVVSRRVGDLAGAAFLAQFELAQADGLRGAARMRSVASGPSTAWLTALPCAATTTLSDPAFISAGRHMLGLGPPTGVEVPPCPCGAEGAGQPDHAMVCKLTCGKITLRHDIWASAWRRIIRKAGCATSAEPVYSGITSRQQRRASAGLQRGDILAVLPSGRVVVLDCVVTHPAAASYVRAAARITGSAAARAEAAKRREFAAHQGAVGFEFVPLAVESFGRMGLAASRFLSDLGDVAAAGGQADKAAFVRAARQELSCALCRGNGLVYGASAVGVARAVGRAFVPGCDQPLDEVGDM
jgi:hypothetical protein